MARIYPAFYKGKEEILVTPETPLPVETKGVVAGVFVKLKNGNQLLEGLQDASSTPVDILSNYTPESNYQTFWLVVYVDGANTTRTAVLVFASLAGSPEFQIAEEVVLGGSYRVIPIQGGLDNYRIQFGDTTYPSFPDTYWRILGG